MAELQPKAEPTSGETWDMTPKRRPDCRGLAKSSGCALGMACAAREEDSRLRPRTGLAVALGEPCGGVAAAAAEVPPAWPSPDQPRP